MKDRAVDDRRALHFWIYCGVIACLGSVAVLGSWFWFFAATMASDSCHGDDTRDICTLAGQQWAVALPMIAVGSAAAVAVLSPIAVAVFRWRAAWVWLGLPLSAAAYAAGPFLANWGRTAGLW